MISKKNNNKFVLKVEQKQMLSGESFVKIPVL